MKTRRLFWIGQSYQIFFDLDIEYTASHSEDVCRTVLGGNIESFQPVPRDLVGLELSPKIVKESRIWLGNEMNFVPEITTTKFSEPKDYLMEIKIRVEVKTPEDTASLLTSSHSPGQ